MYLSINTSVRFDGCLKARLNRLRPANPRKLLSSFDLLCDEINSSGITKSAQSSDHSNRLVAQETFVSELLSRVNIANMTLHKRNADSRQGISKANRSMCKGARVDDNPVDVFLAVAIGTETSGLVNAVDDVTFVVRLEGFEGEAVAASERLCRALDIGESFAAVNCWLAGAEQVEVRSVDDEDGAHSGRIDIEGA